MAARVVDEEGLEVGWAGGQDNFVSADGVSFRAGQGYVYEAFVVQKLTEDTEQVVLMIVPPETEMLTSHVCIAPCNTRESQNTREHNIIQHIVKNIVELGRIITQDINK